MGIYAQQEPSAIRGEGDVGQDLDKAEVIRRAAEEAIILSDADFVWDAKQEAWTIDGMLPGDWLDSVTQG